MYSSFECYKVVFTHVLGSLVVQQNMENKELNQISAKATTNLFTNGLMHCCIIMGYG
jgi:hypothetical protein